MATVIASIYELIEKIGAGGGGTVYLANHLRLGKKVVLKADKRKITARPELLRREVDILKELNHSYIPQVYDFFVEDETVYTVMDYIDGESLDKPLKRGEKFSQPQVIQWAKQLLEALDYLHSPTHGDPPRGYVHSDIKPANIMLTPHNDICLIDFNIALALGEENVVGCSAGYASPEHYGLDYSSFGNNTATIDDNETVTLLEETATLTLSDARSSSVSTKKIVPDVRSDIYSLGATLYHLLSGQRPAKDAREVVPLSDKEFSPQVVGIIAKAMDPNPDMRYQTAQEMLYALNHLYENDSRMRAHKRHRNISVFVLTALFLIGGIMAFTGLRQMERAQAVLAQEERQAKEKEQQEKEEERQAKEAEAAAKAALAAVRDSESAYAKGDLPRAKIFALSALTENTPYWAQGQKALTDALGIYDLEDGFKKYKTVELPSNPLGMVISPGGQTAACTYSGHVAVFETETAKTIATLSTDQSALSEVEYLDEDTIIYAGADGIKSFNITENAEMWSGRPCTAISISQDGKSVAAIYKDDTFATVYDAKTGEVKCELDFGEKHQSVTANDSFANPNDNLFELNEDGSFLAVSFADGSLIIYDLTNSDNDIELFDNTSGYAHFEGGFYQQYLAFSATNQTNSTFAVIDTIELVQTGGFETEGYFGVKTDETGIYVQTDNLLVKVHPVTGEQTPLVTTAETILNFATSGGQTLATSKDLIMFFDSSANMMTSFNEGGTVDFVQIRNGVALIGSIDLPTIKILRHESYPQTNVFEYDPEYAHDEARISADKNTITLFNYKQFRVYKTTGELVKEVDIPNASQVYDQQFVREEGVSYLEVTYNDGKKVIYSAQDGALVAEERVDTPDPSLKEEFYTDDWRVDSPLHGVTTIYDRRTNKVICELSEDGYLTYITPVGEYAVAQFMTTDDYYYGVILNRKGEELAMLPHLCDVFNGELYFDYPGGKVKKSGIYNVEELIQMAQNELDGGK